MSSGYGLNGGTARCFEHWQEFKKCYYNSSDPQECTLQRDDYMECLHRTKEIARAKQVKEQFLKNEQKASKTHREYAEKAATGAIIALGLVEKE